MKRWLVMSMCLTGAACERPTALEALDSTHEKQSESSAAAPPTDANVARKSHAPVELASCAHDPRVMALKTPMRVSGALSQYDFHIVQTKPDPLGRGMNEFSLEVRKGQTVAAGIASLVITPTMPDHGHGAQTVPQVSGKKGAFRVEAVDLFMPGVWRIGVRANNAKGETVETGAFYFCIEG